MKTKYLVLIFFAVLTIINACTRENLEELQPDPVSCPITPLTYNTDIQPIIQSKCAISSCHNAAGAAGGVIFTNYNSVKLHIDHIMERVVIQKDMPTTGPLPHNEIFKIRCWKDAGAIEK